MAFLCSESWYSISGAEPVTAARAKSGSLVVVCHQENCEPLEAKSEGRTES